MLYATKVIISAILIVMITEVAKINSALGGLIKALPVISVISFCWVYYETKDTEVIAELSYSTLWFVLPTLPLFVVFPYLLKRGLGFYVSLSLSSAIMLLCYLLFWSFLKRFNLAL